MAISHVDWQREQYLRTYQGILQQIMSQENAYIFFKPVDPDADGAPDYLRRIPKPMSILLVQEKLDRQEYKSSNDFIEDVRQIWTNAKIYNQQSNTIFKTAQTLAEYFDLLAATLPHEIPNNERGVGLQRLVEDRFALYRAAKRTHK
jgi:hypothetical protein